MKDLEKFFSLTFEEAIKKLYEETHKEHTDNIAYKDTLTDINGDEIPPEGVVALYNDLHNVANKLYMHRWSCDTLLPNEQMKLWSDLRDSLGLPPGTATAGRDVSDENPREIKQLIARCEANELTFDNHDMSVALTEIARLRLTNTEWEAIREATEIYQQLCDDYGPSTTDEENLITLQALLDNHKKKDEHGNC